MPRPAIFRSLPRDGIRLCSDNMKLRDTLVRQLIRLMTAVFRFLLGQSVFLIAQFIVARYIRKLDSLPGAAVGF